LLALLDAARADRPTLCSLARRPEDAPMPKKGDAKPRHPLGDPNDPQGMAALCRAYLDWLRVKNYSAMTVDRRLDLLNHFLKWADDRGLTRPSEITKPILERYQRWLYAYRKPNGDPLSFATQINYLAPLRCWFKWLARNNHILYNPAGEIDLPKRPQTLPRNVLSAEEAEVVLAQPNLADPLGVRDRAVMETLYSTGMRRSEVVGLFLSDIDRSRGVVLIRAGKGQKDRVVPIGERAVGWIDRYAGEVRPRLLIGGKAGQTLFLTNLGEPFTLDRMSDMVAAYVNQAELGKKGSCHLFRHTAATLMLEAGADIRFIQAMLGHANLATTQIYTQVSIKVLKEIHTLTHPAKPVEQASKASKGDKPSDSPATVSEPSSRASKGRKRSGG
jgi:integrase/recombinase XerD